MSARSKRPNSIGACACWGRPMPRPLDTRIDRVEARRMAAADEPGSAAIRPTLRAEAAMGAVIRNALARAGVDAAGSPPPPFVLVNAAPPPANPAPAGIQAHDHSRS